MVTYKPISAFVSICLAFAIFALLLGPTWPHLKVGEKLSYGIYRGGEKKIGTIDFWIENIETIDGVDCYVARYSMRTENRAKAGMFRFDRTGKLRHAKIAYAEMGSLRWVTEIVYSYAIDAMRVIVEDKRDNYQVNELVPLLENTIVAEYLWYLLRLERLHPYYERKFYVHSVPLAISFGRAEVEVIDEETLEMPAGTFDVWVIEGRGVSDKFWVDKGGKAVVKVLEIIDNVRYIYKLESYG